VIRRPYILTDRWNTNGYCSVHVLTEPDTELEQILDAPAAHHDRTFPSPKSGEAVCVYDTGRWLGVGPWMEGLPRLLEELEKEVEVAQAAEKAKEKRKRDEQEADREAKLALARKAACDGFEVEPGVRSGCTANDTGADDCPECGAG
jgi:hypothetical protein